MPKIVIGKNLVGDDIFAESVPFTAVREEWNEYKLESGAVVRVKNVVTAILRTEIKNEMGETVYAVRSQSIVIVSGAPPEDKIAFGFS